MKVTIWTATTDGNDCDLTTTVHATQVEAETRVLGDMGIPYALGGDLRGNLQLIRETWEQRMDGACVIQEHEVEIATSLLFAASTP